MESSWFLPELDVHPVVKSTRQRIVRSSAAFFINTLLSVSLLCS